MSAKIQNFETFADLEHDYLSNQYEMLSNEQIHDRPDFRFAKFINEK